MIRVAVIDRHPVVRAGIEAILGGAPGVRVVAGADGGDPHEIAHALYRTAPDVVMVEDAPGRVDGVELAREIKSNCPGARVLLHADRPDAVQVASAILADADGIVDSGSQPRELVEAVRTIAAGGNEFPELGARDRECDGAPLGPAERGPDHHAQRLADRAAGEAVQRGAEGDRVECTAGGRQLVMRVMAFGGV